MRQSRFRSEVLQSYPRDVGITRLRLVFFQSMETCEVKRGKWQADLKKLACINGQCCVRAQMHEVQIAAVAAIRREAAFKQVLYEGI